MPKDSFQFKQFLIRQDRCAMKVGTDGVLLGAWSRGGKRILDIGCGTGLLSLMMAQRHPDAVVVGVEIDAEAARQARENILASVFSDRVSVVNASIQEYFDGFKETVGSQGFDAIVSNPPYFLESLKNPDAQRTMARHADSLSYSDLLQAASGLLLPDGSFSVVLPVEGCASMMIEEATLHGFFLSRRTDVKIVERKAAKRCLLEFVKRQPDTYDHEVQTLQAADGGRSAWYENLTGDFYLDIEI